MTEDPSGALDNASESAPETETRVPLAEDGEVYVGARWVDTPERNSSTPPVLEAPTPDTDAPDADARLDAEILAERNLRLDAQTASIDALRAATSAAGTESPSPLPSPLQPQLSSDQIAEIEQLHAGSVDAEASARRAFAKPGWRRRLNTALTAEANALFALGFSSFDEFSASHGSTIAPDDTSSGSTETPSGSSTETLARICDMLVEIGIDPGEDPLEAARLFLTTHEPDITAPAPVVAAPAWPEPAREVETAPEAVVPEFEVPEVVVPEVVVPEVLVPEVLVPELDVVEIVEPEAVVPEVAPVVEVADADAPWVSAAQIPAAPEPEQVQEPETDTGDVVDRWINAEARAERMHEEVDRAQAELIALLARSAALEKTVVERVDERDNAHTELMEARARVTELEQSIAESGTDRAEIERALAASRERIAALEGIVAAREQEYAVAASERMTALDAVAGLEATLAERTAELETARATAAERDAELVTRVAELEQSRGELNQVRTTADELRVELETTRRSLEALDAHADAIEAELAEARRKVDSPETKRELEGVRQDLSAARAELEQLQTQRSETEATFTRDQAELDQLQADLMAMRDAADNVRSELDATRHAFEATSAHVESAERAREAITIDAADLMARAETEAANLLERASRDAEAIRQEALLDAGNPHLAAGYPMPELVEQVAKLERKLAKQRKRIDGIIRLQAQRDSEARRRRATEYGRPPTVAEPEPGTTEPQNGRSRPVEVIERFRDELVDLVSRFVPGDDVERNRGE